MPPHRLLQSSMWSPCGVYVESESPYGVLMYSSWSPHGVLMDSTWRIGVLENVKLHSHGLHEDSSWSLSKVLVESSWSPCGVHEDSTGTPCKRVGECKVLAFWAVFDLQDCSIHHTLSFAPNLKVPVWIRSECIPGNRLGYISKSLQGWVGC